MTATADLILERRQMRRRLALWRILAILAFFGAIITAIAVFGGLRGIGSKPSGAHVAVVEISGLITSDRERHEMLEGLAEDDDARAVILRINSPGGTVTGSEELYGDIRAIAEAGKPVVAQMIDAAASGGYIAAIAADHIVARSNTLTASIGVVAEGPNIAGLLADNGISVIRIKPEATPLKAEPGFLTEPAPGAIADQRRLIEDSYAWFRGLVGERRGLEGAALDAVADGRVHTGRLAAELGLVDAIGGEAAVDAWLEETHEVSPDLDRRVRRWGERELPWPLGAMARVTGLDDTLGLVLAPAAARLQPGFRLMAVMY